MLYEESQSMEKVESMRKVRSMGKVESMGKVKFKKKHSGIILNTFYKMFMM